MPTVATIPTYAVSTKREDKRSTRVVFTLTETNTNYIRVWCTSAPEGSRLANALASRRAPKWVAGPDGGDPRVKVHEGDGGKAHPWIYAFDKGGVYTFVCQEYVKGSGFGGGYHGDPRGAPLETKEGTETTLTLTIGERLTHELGAGKDTATLVVWCWGDYIRETTVALHGEDSPAIIDPSSDRARTAAGDAAVISARKALRNIGILAMMASGTLRAFFHNEIYANFNSHMNLGRHAVDDAVNDPDTDLTANVSPEGLPQALAIMARKLRQHMLNDDGTGVGSVAFHEVSGAERADWLNVPIMMSCDSAGAVNMLGDLARALYGHVGGNGPPSVAIHLDNNESGQMPGTGGEVLLELHMAFFTALASNAPTAAVGQGGLAAKLSNYGFHAS